MLLVGVSSKTWNLTVPFPGGCNSDIRVCKVSGRVYEIADTRPDQCEAVDRTRLRINVGATLCTLFLFSGFYHASLQANSRIMRGRRLSERKQAVTQGLCPRTPQDLAL
jgi:hypothetical protein